MFDIVESSDRAKRMIVYPNFKNKLEFSPRVGKSYKLGDIQKGKSFFYRFDQGCSKSVVNKIRRVVSFVNSNYKAYFVVILHSDKLEVARIA